MSAAGKRAKGRAGEAEASKPQLKLVTAPLPAGVPQYLTVDEVATMLRRRPSTIYQLVHKKKIPFRKCGRQLLFEAREIDQWTKDCAGRQ
ncbi:MAG: Helix-turn-helix domain [Acidobacteriota bacterium]|jgi:excisionase family DNA binding protein|nr:Helix-turn-helix domain [Acidobacteriota bacterium]